MSSQSKVLIIQTAFLGDAVLSTSMVEKIRLESPDTQVDLLVRKGNECILSAYPHLNLRHIHVYDKSNKWASWWALRRHLSQESYDQVFVVQRFFGMGLLSISIGAKKVIGFAKNPMAWFFNERVQHDFGNGLHETERNSGLLASWLGKTTYPPSLHVKNYSLPEGLESNQYICISPGSVWETKRLPITKWIEFIHLLPVSQPIVLMGSPNERDLSDQIEAAFVGQGRNIHNETGKHNLLGSTYIYQESLLAFVNDSGPLHLCSAVDTPTVALFCSTIPAFGFGPLSTWNRVIEVREKLACRPCGDHGKKNCPLGHFACGNQIEAKEMLNAYSDYLASRGE